MSDGEQGPAELAQVKRAAALALHALRLQQASEPERVGEILAMIDNEYGPKGMYVALLAWCDAVAEHATDGQPHVPARWEPMFMDRDTGSVTTDTGGPEVPDDLRWAGQLITARINRNEERFNDLIAEKADDAMDAVVSVLIAAACTINDLPRGIALLGVPVSRLAENN
jgi:hypothetical protein